MKKQLLLLISFIFLMAGCNDNTITFSGESDNWEGEYSAILSDNESRKDGEYLFGYKNAKKDTAFKNLKIVINDGETELYETDFKVATVVINDSCSGCAFKSEDEPINVTIKWDGKEESFLLEPRS